MDHGRVRNLLLFVTQIYIFYVATFLSWLQVRNIKTLHYGLGPLDF